jgi:integrase
MLSVNTAIWLRNCLFSASSRVIRFFGEHLDFDRLGQRVVRPAVESLRLDWHGWHGFRRGIASNLYELGANDKIVQRVLRHAKPHVTRERYIKAFDPAVLAAMKRMEAALDVVSKCSPTAYQVN